MTQILLSVGLLALILPVVEVRAEDWPAERLNKVFDGAGVQKAAHPVPVDGSGTLPTEVVASTGQESKSGEAAQDGDIPDPRFSRRINPVTGTPAKLHLAGPDEKVDASPIKAKAVAPPLEEIPDSDWREVGDIEDAISDQNPSSREKQDFWDKLRNQAFWHNLGDSICKKAKIPLKYKLELGDFVNAKPEFSRYMRTGVDGKMILVDRAKLSIGIAGSNKVFDIGEAMPINVSGSADIIGMSMVMRPLKGAKACKELDELIDLRTIKTVYPLKAKRFKAMQVGELWSMPLILRAGLSLGGSYSGGVIPIGISYGSSREGGVNVTLRRLEEKVLRVRIRIDYVRVHGPRIGLNYTFLMDQIEDYRTMGEEEAEAALGTLIGKKLIYKNVDRFVRKTLERYLSLKFHWLAQWVKEDHALIEFILDPTDEGQMQGLEELLAGGHLDVVDSLWKRFKTAAKAFGGLKSLKERLPELAESYEEALGAMGKGAKTFTGTDRVERMVRSFRIKFPFLFDYKRSTGKRDDKITIMDNEGGEFGIYRAHKESQRGFLDIPWVGQIFNYNQRRSIMAFTYEDKDGKALPPSVVYVHQEGYTEQSEDSARELTLKVDELMRLAGTRGQGTNDRAGLPLDRVFPITPRRKPPEPDPWDDDYTTPARDSGPDYDRGMGAFTLVLGEKAIQDVLNASPEDILRSYAVTISWDSDRKPYRWALDNGEIQPDGKVKYNWRKSPWYDPWMDSDDMDADLEDDVRTNLYYGRKLVRKIQEARALCPEGCTDPEAVNRQAALIRDIISKGGYGRSFGDIMKVLVQLTDSENLSAEYIISAKPEKNKKRKVEVVQGRYLLNKGLEEDAGLKHLAEVSQKFNKPSEYTD